MENTTDSAPGVLARSLAINAPNSCGKFQPVVSGMFRVVAPACSRGGHRPDCVMLCMPGIRWEGRCGLHGTTAGSGMQGFALLQHVMYQAE